MYKSSAEFVVCKNVRGRLPTGGRRVSHEEDRVIQSGHIDCEAHNDLIRLHLFLRITRGMREAILHPLDE